jgi:hypothetical protein
LLLIALIKCCKNSHILDVKLKPYILNYFGNFVLRDILETLCLGNVILHMNSLFNKLYICANLVSILRLTMMPYQGMCTSI